MDTSTISRIFSSLLAPVLGLLKKPWAERTAVRNPSTVTNSPIDELNRATFANLGANSSAEESWKNILEMFTGMLVRSEPFSLPHVCEWLNMADTQRQLQGLAQASIASAPEPSDDRTALVDSYMLKSGEHRNRANDIVDHAVKVLVAGVRGAIKDSALGGQLYISVHALQQRFNALDMRLMS